MPPIAITKTVTPVTRAAWRAWLQGNHSTELEVWMLYQGRAADRKPHDITYLDAVEEALCFGWIDSTKKVHDGFTAQRFSPRTKKSNWTELNKERARSLIAAGKMTPAGESVLPDLTDGPLVLASDVENALKMDSTVWRHFKNFPERYKKVRISLIEEVRRKDKKEFERRLEILVDRTRKGQMYGQWDDSSLARSVPTGDE
ncbi:hypothetical protein HDU93_003687 [Gonapodya sp. JEL0774]|nr:hypothetical protein HDU93_003687 [Gonapodya sp. JEL0774]